MRLPPSPSVPLHRCSPLHETTLTISKHPLLFVFLLALFSLANSQMNSSQDKTDLIHDVGSKLADSIVLNETVKFVDSKEYQTLLERSRRKDEINSDSTAEVTDVLKLNFTQTEDQVNVTHQNLEILNSAENVVNNADKETDSIITNLRNENNSIERLRVEDDDRTKIYHDYSIAIEKSSANTDQVNTTDESILDEFLETFVNETILSSNFTSIQENETDVLKEIYIDTKVNISNVPSNISLSSKRLPQSPRPGFMRG